MVILPTLTGQQVKPLARLVFPSKEHTAYYQTAPPDSSRALAVGKN